MKVGRETREHKMLKRIGKLILSKKGYDIQLEYAFKTPTQQKIGRTWILDGFDSENRVGLECYRYSILQWDEMKIRDLLENDVKMIVLKKPTHSNDFEEEMKDNDDIEFVNIDLTKKQDPNIGLKSLFGSNKGSDEMPRKILHSELVAGKVPRGTREAIMEITPNISEFIREAVEEKLRRKR